MNNGRTQTRILAICELLDTNNNLIGYTLDLTIEGIRMIVPNSFKKQSEFYILLRKNEENTKNKTIKLKIQTVWRKSQNEEFDEIGGKIIENEQIEDLKSLLKYCDDSNREEGSLDIYF